MVVSLWFSLDFLFSDADGMVHWRISGIDTLTYVLHCSSRVCLAPTS